MQTIVNPVEAHTQMQWVWKYVTKTALPNEALSPCRLQQLYDYLCRKSMHITFIVTAVKLRCFHIPHLLLPWYSYHEYHAVLNLVRSYDGMVILLQASSHAKNYATAAFLVKRCHYRGIRAYIRHQRMPFTQKKQLLWAALQGRDPRCVREILFEWPFLQDFLEDCVSPQDPEYYRRLSLLHGNVISLLEHLRQGQMRFIQGLHAARSQPQRKKIKDKFSFLIKDVVKVACMYDTLHKLMPVLDDKMRCIVLTQPVLDSLVRFCVGEQHDAALECLLQHAPTCLTPCLEHILMYGTGQQNKIIQRHISTKAVSSLSKVMLRQSAMTAGLMTMSKAQPLTSLRHAFQCRCFLQWLQYAVWEEAHGKRVQGLIPETQLLLHITAKSASLWNVIASHLQRCVQRMPCLRTPRVLLHRLFSNTFPCMELPRMKGLAMWNACIDLKGQYRPDMPLPLNKTLFSDQGAWCIEYSPGLESCLFDIVQL